MKLKSNEKLLETKLNFEPYGEDRPIKDPIEEIIETTESMRDIEEKIFAHIQELEEKYPEYVNFRYDKQIKEEGKGFSAWFDLIGVTSAPVEEEEDVKATVTMTVTKGLGKTGSVAGGTGGMGIGSKSPMAYSSPKTKTRIDATGKVPVWTQKDGTKIEIDKMADRHITNARNMVARNLSAETDKDTIIIYEGQISLLESEMSRRGLIL